MRYSDIRDELQTGDIVLFSGRGLISRIIKLGTFSEWSHVGVVIRLPGYYDGVMMLHSTTLSKVKDAITGNMKRGVSLVELSKVIRTYRGEVGVRRLVDIKRDEDFTSAFGWLRREFHGRKYQTGWKELINSAIDLPFFKNKRNLKTVFCSELVAEGYQRAKLLNRLIPSNEYTPEDFASMSPMRGKFEVLEKIKWG